MPGNLKRLAEKAGVSVATVSRILSGKGRHSPEAVRLVKEAMAELGIAGAGRSQGQGGCIGVALLSCRNAIANDYASETLLTIMETMALEGFSVLLLPVPPSRPAAPFIEDQAARRGLQGLIVLESEHLKGLPEELKKRLETPVVSIGNRDEGGVLNVCADNFQGARDAASYLWSLGHRRFGLLAFPRSDVCIRRRAEGFISYLEERGASPWVKECGPEESSALAAVSELRNMPAGERPSALLTSNSFTAKKLLPELKKAGFKIPEEISLLSFENKGELAGLETPVSAIRQPVKAMAEAAAELLLKAIGGQEASESKILRCDLEERATSGPPPAELKGKRRA